MASQDGASRGGAILPLRRFYVRMVNSLFPIGLDRGFSLRRRLSPIALDGRADVGDGLGRNTAALIRRRKAPEARAPGVAGGGAPAVRIAPACAFDALHGERERRDAVHVGRLLAAVEREGGAHGESPERLERAPPRVAFRVSAGGAEPEFGEAVDLGAAFFAAPRAPA